MLKRIALFYKIIAFLSFIGTFPIMADSLNPLFVFIAGMFITLLWVSFAVIIDAIYSYFEYQTKAINWLVKDRRDGRRKA